MKARSFFNIFLVSVLFIFGFSSCSQDESQNGKPRSLGGTSEILIVLQNEKQWDSQIGQTIRKYFAADQYGLPQNQPIFKLLHLKVSNFGTLFQKHRNIFVVNINPELKKSKIETKTDLWASPQQVFKISAPSAEAFVKIFETKHEYFVNKYMNTERQRILSIFRPGMNAKAMTSLKKSFGFTMDIPAGFYVAKNKSGFMWLRREAVQYSQGLIFISMPYKDTVQFSRRSIIARCQQYERHYIPGPTNGSYMTLDMKFVVPKTRVVNDFPAGYAVEMRGLWKVQNDFMGGPFVSYTFINPKNNKIITALGYVYQPNKKKRNLLLQVESILYSVKF